MFLARMHVHEVSYLRRSAICCQWPLAWWHIFLTSSAADFRQVLAWPFALGLAREGNESVVGTGDTNFRRNPTIMEANAALSRFLTV